MRLSLIFYDAMIMDLLGVDGVQAHGGGLDEDEGVGDSWDGDYLDDSLPSLLDDDGVVRHHGELFGVCFCNLYRKSSYHMRGSQGEADDQINNES